MAFRGAVVHSRGLEQGLEVLADALLVVRDGRVERLVDLGALAAADAAAAVDALAAELAPRAIERLGARALLMPGFVDGHAHAPQYAFAGTAMDLPLLEWLERYTFPAERRFADLSHARRVYDAAVARSLRSGTTTCAWFATLHLDASKLLVDVVRARGQRAHVGKVSMDTNAPETYVEQTDAAIADAGAFAEHVLATSPPAARAAVAAVGADDDATGAPASMTIALTRAGALVTPAVIPRFVPTCSARLMDALGALAARRRLPVHTHLSENPSEIAWVRSLHPARASYADVYAHHGLMPPARAYFAHCVHCGAGERSLLRARGAGVVHCPTSNFMLSSGVLDVRRLLRDGNRVGLGTDVAGGYASSMLVALRHATLAGRAAHFRARGDTDADADADARGAAAAAAAEPHEPLTAHEAFHLATAGGAEALGLGGEVGDLAPGKLFDALLIDADVDDAPFDVFYDGDDAADGDAADDDDDDAAPRKRARREADADARATAAAAARARARPLRALPVPRRRSQHPARLRRRPGRRRARWQQHGERRVGSKPRPPFSYIG